MNQYKPRVIGIDVFDTNNPNKDHDILLANVLKQYKNIVLAELIKKKQLMKLKYGLNQLIYFPNPHQMALLMFLLIRWDCS